MNSYALILAGGSGSRMQTETPKSFIKINGLFIFEYSLLAFAKNPHISHVILVVPQNFLALTKKHIQNTPCPKIHSIIAGGKNRFQSSALGISQIKEKEAFIMIHDAARPLIRQTIINKNWNALQKFEAVNTLIPLKDSIVQLGDSKEITSLNRHQFQLVQTPQSFKLSCIKKAQTKAEQDSLDSITDDFALVSHYKTGTYTSVEGEQDNFKITHPIDLKIFEFILSQKAAKT